MRGRYFRIRESLFLLLIAGLMVTMLLPVLAQNEFLSRTAVCSNNMKAIGVGLELWRQNSGRYPMWDFGQDSSLIEMTGGKPNLAPWPDMLVMQKAFTPENIEAYRTQLTQLGMPPEYFIKTVENDKIFYCPADHSHPHRINEERARQWSFWREEAEDGYEYSYGISTGAVYKISEKDDRTVERDFHKDASCQILSADGVWSWMRNFSGTYVDNPDSTFLDPSWYSNTVGYFHGRGNQAVVVMRDSSVKYVNYGTNGNGIDFNETFFYGKNETVNVFRY